MAILYTAAFDAPSKVDKASLTFGKTGDEESLTFCNKSAEDVNDDGLPDLVRHFNTQNTASLRADSGWRGHRGTLLGGDREVKSARLAIGNRDRPGLAFGLLLLHGIDNQVGATRQKCPLGKYGEPVVAQPVRSAGTGTTSLSPSPGLAIGHFSKGTGELNKGLKSKLGALEAGQPLLRLAYLLQRHVRSIRDVLVPLYSPTASDESARSTIPDSVRPCIAGQPNCILSYTRRFDRLL